MARVKPKSVITFTFREWTCPICGKIFIPATFHVYREGDEVFCGWNCLREYRRRKEERKTLRKGLKK